MIPVAIDLVVVIAALVVYYKVLLVLMRDRLVSATVPFMLRRFRRLRHPVGDIENITTFVYSVVLQIALLVVLCALTTVELRQLRPSPEQPLLLLLGAVLGFGEMLLAAFLGLVVIKVSATFPHIGNPLAQWQITMNSGWMRLFKTTIKVLPLPAAIPLVTLYVGVEELIVRGIVLNVLLPFGKISAVLLSTAIFVGYQLFNLPSWRVGLFPAMGALVMGPIHGLLYVLVPDVWPLVVAHVTYFTIVALTFR